MVWELFGHLFKLSRAYPFYFSFLGSSFYLLFVKASKALALSITFLPILGCALGTGILFAALVRAVSYAPDNEDVLFNYTALGFAFIETFAFTLFFVAMIVFIM